MGRLLFLRINELEAAITSGAGQLVPWGWGEDNLSHEAQGLVRSFSQELAPRSIHINIYIQPAWTLLLFQSAAHISPPDVVFEGKSREVIRSFPKDIRSDLGADLDRVQNGEKPLDSAPMAPVLPGVFELRDEAGTSGIGCYTSRSRVWFMFSTASGRRPTRRP